MEENLNYASIGVELVSVTRIGETIKFLNRVMQYEIVVALKGEGEFKFIGNSSIWTDLIPSHAIDSLLSGIQQVQENSLESFLEQTGSANQQDVTDWYYYHKSAREGILAVIGRKGLSELITLNQKRINFYQSETEGEAVKEDVSSSNKIKLSRSFSGQPEKLAKVEDKLIGKRIRVVGDPRIPGSCERLELMHYMNFEGAIVSLHGLDILVSDTEGRKVIARRTELHILDNAFRPNYPNHLCRMCADVLTEDNVSKKEDCAMGEGLRLDSQGYAWCKTCTEKHDSIDWG